MADVPYRVRDIGYREFGFVFVTGQKYNEKKDVTEPISHFNRKIGFATDEELWKYIRNKKPDDCYFSTAYWTFPRNACTPKGFWNGADLFFDLDSKDLNLAREEAEIVYDDLQVGFGIQDIEMIFSGRKGYHVVGYGYDDPVLTTKLRMLKTVERGMIANYFLNKFGKNDKIEPRLTTIDREPTIDIHRLRRLPGTINSKSGTLCEVVKLNHNGGDEYI